MAAKITISCVIYLLVLSFVQSTSAALYNVVAYGAKGDGKTNSTQSFQEAWTAACSSATASTIYVPKGRYLITAVVFIGPCKNRIKVWIDGRIIAPEDYTALGNSGYWILFNKVDNLTVVGGTLDAKGAAFWACRNSSGSNCQVGARSMSFNRTNNLIVSGLKSINSQITHLVVNNCNNVTIRDVKIHASGQSPNTDGIHLQSSNHVIITGSTIQTGDDCISIGRGTRNLYMDNINCGPGHAISLGSLGRELIEDGIENITLIDSVFNGSLYGARIKSRPNPSNAFVRNVLFQNLTMVNAGYPIIIDQNYCPYNTACPPSKNTSGVKISEVTYRNIRGTSATTEAVTFDCSPSNPCTEIRMEDINLISLNETATARCKNINGTSSGVISPKSCLREN